MKATHPSSIRAVPARGDIDPNARAKVVGQAWQILLPLIVVAGLIVLWLATAPAAGPVVSSHVKVDQHRRIVQHQEERSAPEALVRDDRSWSWAMHMARRN